MDERDLFKSLSASRFKKQAAGEYLKKMLNDGAMFAHNNKESLLGLIGGGLLAGGLQYRASKPGKDGQPSKERQSREKALAESTKKVDDAKAKGKEPKFSDELLKSLRTGGVETSKVLEKHPKKGALLAAPVGASLGAGIGYAAKKYLR